MVESYRLSSPRSLLSFRRSDRSQSIDSNYEYAREARIFGVVSNYIKLLSFVASMSKISRVLSSLSSR